MADLVIDIENCNNIKNGQITIRENKLNILFGRNGTGKSTIAQAIDSFTKGKSLDALTPYGDSSQVPSIDGLDSLVIAIFNETYVKSILFQKDSVIANAFDVLVRSPEYDEAKNNIDEALKNIRTTINDSQEIEILRKNIANLIEKIKLTSSGSIDKRGGSKGVLEGKNALLFNPPEELSSLKPFLGRDSVLKWASWRLEGFKQFGSKACCPYCSTGETETSRTIDKTFLKSFDKSSLEVVLAISKALYELKDFIDQEKPTELLSNFGVDGDLVVLENQLQKLMDEANYLYSCLNNILNFNGSSVSKENIGELENKLRSMKVNFDACGEFFCTQHAKTELGAINDVVDELLTKVRVLQAEIGKYNTYIQTKIKDRESDINDFLRLAGFKYSFHVEVSGEGEAKALLKFILPNGETAGIETPIDHLSWGEKNAFALVLFMFDAISKKADLIILDDPISSFDFNKKYAIINRLFKTGVKNNSLYERTVLMLTHDFEPIIDYVQTHSGRQTPNATCANYIENVEGTLKTTSIEKNRDLLSSVVLLKELAKDSSIDIAARVGCLRKFIEHQYKDPITESDAYHILSSLIHGRETPTEDASGETELSANQIASGEKYIKRFIPDFDYSMVLKDFSATELIRRYLNEASSYIKMLILRAFTEQKPEAKERLREKNDVLRKYIDETYHIENDYIYTLDIRRFNIVPDNYISDADEFVKAEGKSLGIY